MSGNLLHPDAIKDDQKRKQKRPKSEPRSKEEILRSIWLSLLALALIITASLVYNYYQGNFADEEEANGQVVERVQGAMEKEEILELLAQYR